VAGRINEEDIGVVRERSRIDDVVGTVVTLTRAGSGQLQGLCPFHDEKSPSFHVTPAKGFYYCFGCGKGGDVIDFVREIHNLSFAEAVEWLADRAGVQLRYEDGPGTGPRVAQSLKMRLYAANKAAEEFFAGHLGTPEALVGRQFLDSRGFDADAARRFGCGFAPTSGRALRDHLLAKGFTREELIGAGLVREAGWDFFQGRLVWPIRDSGSTTLGFGARRLLHDDRMPAKYLNTPETPIYKKSHVLYGLDLAGTNMGKKNQAVVVEGYTDVMACHLAGVDTAVASCGTAFGADHSRMIHRRITDPRSGEVIFTFDGDAAGQAAALKVFREDEAFAAQTYVAVEPSGLDPCDLRLQQGDAALRELVARRQPLYRFVMRHFVARHDLDRVEGRLAAVREAADLVKSIRDPSRVSGYLRELAGMVGMDDAEVRAEVARVTKRRPADEPRPLPREVTDPGAQASLMMLPDPRDRRLQVERETLRFIVQEPSCFDEAWNLITTDDFQHPTYIRLFDAACETEDRSAGWPQRLAEAIGDPVAEQLVAALAVEPLQSEPTRAYAAKYSAQLRLLAVGREIDALKSRLQRTNPVDNQPTYNRMFVRLLELEARRRELQAEAIGEE
jgi:DNA primase